MPPHVSTLLVTTPEQVGCTRAWKLSKRSPADVLNQAGPFRTFTWIEYYRSSEWRRERGAGSAREGPLPASQRVLDQRWDLNRAPPGRCESWPDLNFGVSGVQRYMDRFHVGQKTSALNRPAPCQESAQPVRAARPFHSPERLTSDLLLF